MSKIIWILNAILSLAISIAINFNATSVSALLIGSLITGLIIFFILTFLIKSIQNIKQKNTKNAIIFGVLFIAILLIISLGYLLNPFKTSCLIVTTDNFRTNIFTGQCEFGGSSSCGSDPWYYKQGCDISNEEKIEILKDTQWYNRAVEECNRLCQGGFSEAYCSDRISQSIEGEISCNDLVLCDTISCD